MNRRQLGVLGLITALGMVEVSMLSIGRHRSPPEHMQAQPAPKDEPREQPPVLARAESLPKPAPVADRRPAASAAPQNATTLSLAQNPGTHIGDEIGRLAAAEWEREQTDPIMAPRRESAVRDLFEEADVPDVLRNVECRNTLCQLMLAPSARSHVQNGQHELAGKLGASAAVVENDENGIVVLIPGEDIALE